MGLIVIPKGLNGRNESICFKPCFIDFKDFLFLCKFYLDIGKNVTA